MKTDKLNIKLITENVSKSLSFLSMPLHAFPWKNISQKTSFWSPLQLDGTVLLKFWSQGKNGSVCIFPKVPLKNTYINLPTCLLVDMQGLWMGNRVIILDLVMVHVQASIATKLSELGFWQWSTSLSGHEWFMPGLCEKQMNFYLV